MLNKNNGESPISGKIPCGAPPPRAVAYLPAKMSSLRSKITAPIQNVKTSSTRGLDLYKCRCMSSGIRPCAFPMQLQLCNISYPHFCS